MLHRLADATRIGTQLPGAGIDGDGKVDPAIGGGSFHPGGRGARHIGQLHHLASERHVPLALGQVEYLVDQHAKPADRIENGGDILLGLIGQCARIACLKHFCEAADRGERRTQFVAHVGDKSGLHLIGGLERRRPIAQRLLGTAAVADVEHGEQRIAIGQGNGGKGEVTAIRQRHAAVALLAIPGGRPDQLADQGSAVGRPQLGRDLVGDCVDPRMTVEELFLEIPQGAETMIPQLQPAVGGEHAQRLEQIVKGGRSHAKQRVARRGELHFFRAILENQQEPAVGQQLREHANVDAAGQVPRFLRRGVGAGEPVAPLRLPAGKVADLGYPVRLAHALQHPVEFGAIRQPFAAHREHAAERLVAEQERAVAAELRHAGG